MFKNIRQCNFIHPNYLDCCWRYQESIKRKREEEEKNQYKNEYNKRTRIL